MILTLIRTIIKKTYTQGELYIDGAYFCDTIEPPYKKLKSAEEKLPNGTAIPYGTYKVVMYPSAKFHRILPMIADVPFFSGILIHAGNTAADTRGCLLVGKKVRSQEGKIMSSNITLAELMSKMKGNDYIVINIAPAQQILIA